MTTMHNYMDYLKLEEAIVTDEGKKVEVFHLDIQEEPEIFEEWAIQFRRNYCSDERLKHMTSIMGIKSSKYLVEYKLPCVPSTKSGDFGEILVSDYLQYFENYLVPRTRFNSRENKDKPTLGSDALGYKYDPNDPDKAEVIVLEVKTSASNKTDFEAQNKLQKAIDDSNKDFVRFSTSIVASYEKLLNSNQAESDILSRFLNITDNPFQVKYGAVAVHSNSSFNLDIIKQVITESHVAYDKLKLMVIHSEKLMDFVNELYMKASEV